MLLGEALALGTQKVSDLRKMTALPGLTREWKIGTQTRSLWSKVGGGTR